MTTPKGKDVNANGWKSSGITGALEREIISDDKEVAEIFNKFFVNIVPDLKIPARHNCNKNFQKLNDAV